MQNTYSSYPSNVPDLFPEERIIYASFGQRLGAAFIDGLILLIPNYLLKGTFGLLGTILIIAIAWFYSALQESGSDQATIGKKVVGLKVVSGNGEPLSFGQASGRFFGKYLSTLLLFIGYFMMLWDEKRQTLHDKIADTLVVKS